jgi:hypothetical protein
MTTKGREPVTGLLGAVQQLSPTIPTSFGRTPVQVPQSIPWQETGVGKVAQALGIVVEGVQVAKDIGEIRGDEYQDYLNKLNFEDFQKEVKQNQEEFGSDVRTNKIPFLGNPWNQEAVREAAGARYHDEYQLRLNEELQKSNTLETTQAVINRVYQKMVDDFEITDPILKRGFDMSIRGLNQKASLQYDTLKNKQASINVLQHGESALYEASSDPDTYGEIDEWWKNHQATFKPAELIQLIEDVAVRHAKDGNQEAADDFLEYAERYLPIGQRTLEDGKVVTDLFAAYTSEVADIREKIKDAADKSDTAQEKEARDFLIDVAAEAGQVAYALSQGNTYTLEDGTEITSQEQYTAVANERAAATKNPYTLTQIFSTLDKAYTGAESVTKEDEGSRLVNDLQGVGLSIRNRLEDTKKSILTQDKYLLRDELGDPTKVDPTLKAIADNLDYQYQLKSFRKAQEVAQGSYINVEGERITGASENEKLNALIAWDAKFIEEYQQELEKTLNAKKERRDLGTTVADIGKVSDKSFTDPSGELLKDKVAEFGNVEYFTGGLGGKMPVNIDEIEWALRNGNNQQASFLAKLYDAPEQISPVPFAPVINTLSGGLLDLETVRSKPTLDKDLRILRSVQAPQGQKERAGRNILVYLYASKGANFYSPEAIRKGVVNIKGQEVPIDKEALVEMANIVPLISKDRLLQISKGGDQDLSDVYDIVNAIYGTSLEYNDKDEIDSSVQDFITNTKALYEKR